MSARSSGALPAHLRAKVRELHRLEPRRNVRRLSAFALVWASAGYVALHAEPLVLRCAAYFVIGATMQGLGTLMHDAAHGLLFRRRFWNDAAGILCGLPALLSLSAYRIAHLPHHRFERGAMDPDELENLTREPRALAGLFVLVFLAGDLIGYARVGPFAARSARARDRRRIAAEYALIAGVFGALFWTLPIGALAGVWIFPALVARQLSNVRTLAEHVLTGHEDRWTLTRTVLSNRFVAFFMCNANYHIEHHLFPAAPWYHLPEIHRLIREELKRRGAQVYPSYTRFLIDLARWMARAWNPRLEPPALRLAA